MQATLITFAQSKSMDILLWAIQLLLALIFMYSGICKSFFPIQKLVAMGQTGVDGLPVLFVSFIGITEIMGVAGLILPWLLSLYPVITPISAICFAFIMPFAAFLHLKRARKYKQSKEIKNVMTNIFIFLLCLIIAYARWEQIRY